MHNVAVIEAINDAIGSHGMWKMRLRTAISSHRCEISSATACCDDQCAFGKWLHGPSLDGAIKAGIPYAVVKRLHAEFHRSAGNVLGNVERGNLAQAQFVMDGEYTERSEKLVRALMKWKGELARPGQAQARFAA